VGEGESRPPARPPESSRNQEPRGARHGSRFVFVVFALITTSSPPFFSCVSERSIACVAGSILPPPRSAHAPPPSSAEGLSSTSAFLPPTARPPLTSAPGCPPAHASGAKGIRAGTALSSNGQKIRTAAAVTCRRGVGSWGAGTGPRGVGRGPECWKYALESTGFDPLVGSDGFDPLWCKSPNGPQML
jgi:hypothetical protein